MSSTLNVIRIICRFVDNTYPQVVHIPEIPTHLPMAIMNSQDIFDKL